MYKKVRPLRANRFDVVVGRICGYLLLPFPATTTPIAYPGGCVVQGRGRICDTRHSKEGTSPGAPGRHEKDSKFPKILQTRWDSSLVSSPWNPKGPLLLERIRTPRAAGSLHAVCIPKEEQTSC